MNDIKQLDKTNVRLSKQMYQSKLLEMDKQLASSIQTQVVETNRALELLKLSFEDIINIQTNFQQIDDKCKQCKNLLTQFDEMKQLSLARNNLHITTRIGKLFREVPNKAKNLLNLLENNPDTYLFYVYKNLRKLVKLKDEVLNRGLKYMNDKSENMKNHFNCLQKLIFTLEKQVRMNICDALYLAVEQPETLVETLKICESEDKTHNKNHKILTYSIDHWSKWREQESDKSDNSDNADNSDDKYIAPPLAATCTMKEKVKSEILSSIIGLTENLQIQKEKGIKEFLSSIDDNMKDLDYVNENVRITFPEHYNIVTYYVSTYYKFLQPLILAQLDENAVPTQERLFVVSWINKFKLKILSLEKDMSKYNIAITDISYNNILINLSNQEEELLLSYIDTCRNKLASWIKNIVENETKKQEYFMVDNIPRTHCPQDLFTALNHQFIIATQQLRGKPFVNVINMILESMDYFRKLLLIHINDNWMSFSDEYFCAILNSCYDVSNKLKIKCDNILEEPDLYNLNSKQQTVLDDNFDKRICMFTNMGKMLSIKLSDKIYTEALKENVFDVLFKPSEYLNNPSSVEYIKSGMIATLSDYFDDLKQWIEEAYFYWELIKNIINIITEQYINALIINKPNYDIKQLAVKIEQDINALNDYFGNTDEFSDVNKLWKQKHKILASISGALSCDDGFFEAFAKPLRDYTNNNQKDNKNPLLHYIIKQRKKWIGDDDYDDNNDNSSTNNSSKKPRLNFNTNNFKKLFQNNDD